MRVFYLEYSERSGITKGPWGGTFKRRENVLASGTKGGMYNRKNKMG